MNESLVRCFVAVELPRPVLQEIGDFARKLSGISSGVRWVRPEGIHLTLKFLGEIGQEKVREVTAALGGIRQVCEPFDLVIRGSGCFPNARQPRVIWLGLEHDRAHSLFKLHEWLDAELAAIGFEKEKRRFSPHLTLGRVKAADDFTRLFQYLDQNPFPDRTFRVDHVYFMRSRLQPAGAVYSAIADFPLGVSL